MTTIAVRGNLQESVGPYMAAKSDEVDVRAVVLSDISIGEQCEADVYVECTLLKIMRTRMSKIYSYNGGVFER